ncbi:MAG: UDP-N-acetylglucosamine--N-acetylmuramyl-(pentapeptide) pyrophosphoryl-undecaprenol N-acetylglucosamine transferase [Clostridia bacterium]|nr:UDP-N-acetylglucosamine--N-acetylmuramyl-(pentapeptide) pyrophosphoryl-undecaprenol N-acetylglucosamine transferase [Clostridia bacterium]
MKTIILTGGGTAGHVIPNIALFEGLNKYFERIVYIGSGNDLEKQLVCKYDFVQYLSIPTVKLIRGFSFKNLTIPFRLILAIKEAKKLLKQINPDIIFNKGGYVGLPVVLAGAKLNIPIIGHESDLSLGLAHKLVKNKYRYICTTFAETAEKLKNGIYTGTPIQQKAIKTNFLSLKEKLHLNALPVILVLGGSQGAQQINNLIDKNLDKLTKQYQIIHVRGKNKLNPNLKKHNYLQFEFYENMGELYATCDACITRAGSNTLHELLYNNIPMVLIPLQNGSRGDQVANAHYFDKHGWSTSLYNKSITNDEFLTAINQMMNKSKNNKQHMPTNCANEKIIDLIVKVSDKKTR